MSTRAQMHGGGPLRSVVCPTRRGHGLQIRGCCDRTGLVRDCGRGSVRGPWPAHARDSARGRTRHDAPRGRGIRARGCASAAGANATSVPAGRALAATSIDAHDCSLT